MTRQGGHRLSEASAWSIATAMACAVADIILAAFLPIKTVQTNQPGWQPRYSLLHADGAIALVLAAIPLAVSGLVLGLLLLRRRAADVAAWILSCFVCAAALIGFVTFLIGVYVIPVGVLLAVGCAKAHDVPKGAPAWHQTAV